HVGPDVLAQRLRELEAAGIVRRGTLPPPAGSRVYALTERGQELEPVVLALGRWGSQAPFPPGSGELGDDAMVLALKTVFSPARAEKLRGRTFELRLRETPFAIRVSETALEASRGPAIDPVAVITTEPGILQQVLWRGRPVRAGGLEIDGDRRAGERFLTLFPPPA
ncbi:MAG TPA: winged helix-turn-helix transcriptional regulator, partial [Solirubrobacteraceae bacterium]|nr:winged helix-turn-helix transcriptional regulator [Solirubrobacteraceae bacterium]